MQLNFSFYIDYLLREDKTNDLGRCDGVPIRTKEERF